MVQLVKKSYVTTGLRSDMKRHCLNLSGSLLNEIFLKAMKIKQVVYNVHIINNIVSPGFLHQESNERYSFFRCSLHEK